MNLRLLNLFEFDQFAQSHPLRNFYQSSDYAILMAEMGYDYEFIGMTDNNQNIVAASLVLYKKIGTTMYGYAPKGFLIDYFDQDLVRTFLDLVKKHYAKKNFAFIKINPEIAVGEYSEEKQAFLPNQNKNIGTFLESLGLRKLKDNLYFEAMLPRYNAILPLSGYSEEKISKRNRNKVHKTSRKGLELIKGTREDILTFYTFVKNKENHPESYYNYLFNIFSKNDKIDLFLVKMQFEEFLINTRYMYEQEQDFNAYCNERLGKDNTEANLNRKMQSDRALLSYKNDIMEATKHLSENSDQIIAGALVLKFQNRICILYSGYDSKYRRSNPNYFIHHKIFEYYKDTFRFADLNGITGDLTNENPFKGLNDFKLGWNPLAYEFIGEFDLVLNELAYHSLMKNGLLAKEFNKNKKAK